MIGVIGGTSFFHTPVLREGRRERVVSPYGSVEVVRDESTVMISRHGVEGSIPPHAVNHHAHIWVLRNLNVEGVVCFGSVGGLSESFTPGTLLLASDYYAPYRTVTFHTNSMATTIPRLMTPWREHVARWLNDAGIEFVKEGVYAETLGLRFETQAEVQALARDADVVGMTCASEATLAREIGLPVAILAMVDNVAHGLGVEPLTGDAFHAKVRENEAAVVNTLQAIRHGASA